MAEGVPFLTGERIYLRALMESDADGPYAAWFNDPEVCQGNSHHVFPYTKEAALGYIRHAKETRTELILAIVLKDSHRHIGNIALQGIHQLYRSAEFSILIGDKETWSKGFGKEAALLLLAHGFDTLNLNRISCGTFAGNAGMRKLAEGLGMKKEGERREAAWKNGKFVDVVEYGILRSEFKGKA
jgi:[ribosomal protein S5]-alanine N-acetyltransferase